jgi:hypothetical protein
MGGRAPSALPKKTRANIQVRHDPKRFGVVARILSRCPTRTNLLLPFASGTLSVADFPAGSSMRSSHRGADTLFRWMLPKLTFLAFGIALCCRTATAFCLQPAPTVTCEFLNSTAVFVGTVIASHEIRSDDGQTIVSRAYVLTVQELFRGPRGKNIWVYTANDSGRLPLDLGRQYLLFADEADMQLHIFGCGNSGLASRSAAAILELKTLRIPRDSEIEGRISTTIPGNGPPLPSFRIIVRGRHSKYFAITDKHGWFHVHLPPGDYSAAVEPAADWRFSAYDLSFDKPSHFTAVAGRCTGLQFVATRR